MYNAIIDDEYLNPMGIYKERLSQSALVAEMRLVDDGEARAAYRWLLEPRDDVPLRQRRRDRADRGPGARPAPPVHRGDAHRRPASAATPSASSTSRGSRTWRPPPTSPRGCSTTRDRPPVAHVETGGRAVRRAGRCPHFNEVDEGSAVDAPRHQPGLDGAGLDPATTLHDVRWGDPVRRRLRVGVRDLRAPCRRRTSSAATPAPSASASHRSTSGSAAARSRASAGRARSSGAGCSSWTARCTWTSGAAPSSSCREAETERRWQATTPQWPIMHAVLHGVTRDQMMARHRANHIQVAYARRRRRGRRRALAAKAAMFDAMGIVVHLCGDVPAASVTDLLLGIDVGTESSKGVLLRPDGSFVADARAEHGMSVPRPGWAEQDADASGGPTCARSRGARGGRAGGRSDRGGRLQRHRSDAAAARRGRPAAAERDPVRRRHAGHRADRGARGTARGRGAAGLSGHGSRARRSVRRSRGSPSTSPRSRSGPAGS